MKRKLLVSAGLAILIAGCAHYSSTVTETKNDGTSRTTTTTIIAFLEANSDMAKSTAGQGSGSNKQSVGISGLKQEATSSNVVAMLTVVVNGASNIVTKAP